MGGHPISARILLANAGQFWISGSSAILGDPKHVPTLAPPALRKCGPPAREASLYRRSECNRDDHVAGHQQRETAITRNTWPNGLNSTLDRCWPTLPARHHHGFPPPPFLAVFLEHHETLVDRLVRHALQHTRVPIRTISVVRHGSALRSFLQIGPLLAVIGIEPSENVCGAYVDGVHKIKVGRHQLLKRDRVFVYRCGLKRVEECIKVRRAVLPRAQSRG